MASGVALAAGRPVGGRASPGVGQRPAHGIVNARREGGLGSGISVPDHNPRPGIALSFPGEHRDSSRTLLRTSREILANRVLYDRFYEAEFARPELDIYPQRLYHDESELIVVLLCADYERKEWCGLEWRVVRDLTKRRKPSTVMPLRFDMTEVPGLFSIVSTATLKSRPRDIFSWTHRIRNSRWRGLSRS